MEENVKQVFKVSTSIIFLQRELEGMLKSIRSNKINFQEGNIPKAVFESMERQMKKFSVDLIKKTNKLIEKDLKLIDSIAEGISSQKIKVEAEAEEAETKKEKKVEPKPKKVSEVKEKKVETKSEELKALERIAEKIKVETKPEDLKVPTGV